MRLLDVVGHQLTITITNTISIYYITKLQYCNIAILQYYCLQVHDPELKEQVFRQLQQQLDFIFPDGLVSGSGATAVYWRVSSSGRCILGSGFASCCGSMSPRGM